MQYTPITKQDFEDFILPLGFSETKEEGVKEAVYIKPIDILNLKIYSTIVGNVSRGIGKDAIRCLLTSDYGIIGGEKRTNRAGTPQEVFSRLKEKIESLEERGNTLNSYYTHFTPSEIQNLDGIKECDGILYSIKDKETKKGKPCKSITLRTNLNLLNGVPVFVTFRTFDNSKVFNEIQILEVGLPLHIAISTDYRVFEKNNRAFLVLGKYGYLFDNGVKINVIDPTKKPIKTPEITPIVEDTTYPLLARKLAGELHPRLPAKLNPMQLSTLDKGLITSNNNFIISSPTASGKTLVAELVIAKTLKEGKKAIYLCPMRSLTEEKLQDFRKLFSKYNVTALSSDYDDLTPTRQKEVAASDIIVMTNEMLGSRCTKFKSEKNLWLLDVGVLAVDECFTGNTRILIGRNVDIPIKMIYERDNIDHVFSYNHKKQVIEKKRILRKIKRKVNNELMIVTYKINNNIKETVCTPNHKFWVKNKGYTPAYDLHPNDIIKGFPIDDYYCEICKRMFKNKRALTTHFVSEHVRSGKYTCNVCKKTFRRIEDLKSHKVIHESPKYLCSICNKSFHKKSSYTNHMNSHNTRYICEVCNVSFTKKIDLMQHLRKFHSAIVYKCPYCDKEFYGKVTELRKIMGKYASHISFTHKKEKYDESMKKINYNEIVKKRQANPDYWKSMKKMGEGRQGKDNPLFRNDNEGLKNLKKTHRKRWDKLPNKEKEKIIKRFQNAPIYTKGKITSLEHKIIDLNIPGVEYKGNGDYWVTFNCGKKKNPDFIVNGQKKVVEVGDIEFWHTKEEIKSTIKKYEEAGYKCLYLTNVDIKALSKDELYNKIKTFVDNHDIKVFDVRKWNGSAEYVYNLEIEDNHNYIANNVLVSNCHLLSAEGGRGENLEVAIISFADTNPSSRFILLSATMNKLTELKNWIERITHNKTTVIESDYRPTKLNIHSVGYEDYSRPWEAYPKITETLKIIKEHNKDKFLVFCPSRHESRYTAEVLKKNGYNAEFHNAELNHRERTDVESKFKNGDLQIIASTPTLSIGVNLPSRRVIIQGTYRGINQIDPIELSQCCGRAGRPKYDTEGDAYIIHPLYDDIDRITNIDLTSKLLDEDNLQLHILNQIFLDRIAHTKDAISFWERTFAHQLEIDYPEYMINNIISKFKQWGMIELNEHNRIRITRFGCIAPQFYVLPKDIHSWHMKFNELVNENQLDNDFWLCYAITPKSDVDNENYVSKKERERVNTFYHKLANHGVLVDLPSAKHIERYYNALTTDTFQVVRFDMDRKIQAIKLIDAFKGGWGIQNDLEKLALRFQHGIPEEALSLITIKGIGRSRALKLVKNDIKTPVACLENEDKVKKLLGKKTGENILDEIVISMK